MLRKTTFLKLFGIFCFALMALVFGISCSATKNENTYEEILQIQYQTESTQESTESEHLFEQDEEVITHDVSQAETAEKLKDNYMKDIMAKIEEKKKLNRNEDILFIGNSLTEGMRLTTNSNNDFISEVGISLDGLSLKDMKNMDFKVVVINMGTNELGNYTEERFKKSYENLINEIYKVNPNAKIVCGSVPPIAEKTQYANTYNNENAKLYSRYIKDLCTTHNLEYLDNSEFFGDVLRPEWTEDGLHFSGNIYIAWYEFIIKSI